MEKVQAMPPSSNHYVLHLALKLILWQEELVYAPLSIESFTKLTKFVMYCFSCARAEMLEEGKQGAK